MDNAVTCENVTAVHISHLLGLFLDELEARGTSPVTAAGWLSDEWLWDAHRPEFKKLPYAEYLQTEHWQTVRRGALVRADFKCQLCSASQRDVELHVHHNTYARLGHERPSDLVVLCARHHAAFHNEGPA